MPDKTTTTQDSKLTFIYVIASVAAMAGLLFGYDTGVISGAILFIKNAFSLSPFAEEMVVSSVLLGAIIGAGLSGGLSDSLGRKHTIIITAIIFIFSALGSAFAGSMPVLVLCRLLIGVAIGIASFAAPLYISEVAPPAKRGGLVSMNQLMITIGIVVSFFADYLLAGDGSWRWMFALGAIPAILLTIGMVFLPKSPRWLLSKKLSEKARETLLKIRSIEDDVDKEIDEINATLDENPGTWKDLFSPWLKPVLFLGIIMAFFQQATGINTVIYYAPTIFNMAGFSSAKAAILATGGVGIINVLMTIVAIRLLDRTGRKPLLKWGLIGMSISLISLGTAFAFPGLAGSLKWITVLSLIAYIASFAISLGPIVWLLIAEIYPLKVRGRAMGLATMANWAFNMLVASTFLTLIEKLGKSGTFFMFGIVSIAGIFYCAKFVPETKGVTLEAIEDHLKSGKKFAELGE